MKTSDLVFIGIKGTVLALDRSTGNQVWAAQLRGEFVNVAVQNGAVIASCNGEIYCLDPVTGNVLWHNPLKGYGLGLATIAGESNAATGSSAVLAAKTQSDQEAATGATVAVTMVAAG